MANTGVLSFVEDTWGAEDVRRIKNVRQGGDNNDKGGRYEASFAAYLIAKYESAGVGNQTLISAQEVAWVDDLCVRTADQRKINYQAKNSSGDSADWTADIQERFEKQKTIDESYHGAVSSRQVLLVSDEVKHSKNKEKIPDEMVDFATCEFYPYFERPTHALLEHDPTFDAVAALCEDPMLDNMEIALKSIMGQWANHPGAEPVLVGDLIADAKSEIKPNIFKTLDTEATGSKLGLAAAMEPLEWLSELISPFPSASMKVQSSGFRVNVRTNAGEASILLPQDIPTEGSLPSKVGSEQELVALLFKLASQARL
ncbi:hypothetical protein GCM10027040_13090 [Halomonas shantousis]